MLKHIRTEKMLIPAIAGCAVFLGAPVTMAGETEEYDEARVYIEINASDGDAGFLAKVDGDPWKEVSLNGSKLFNAQAYGSLREQGLTEEFFESDEPPCYCEDPGDGAIAEELEEYEECLEEKVTVAEVLERFPDGAYVFTGKSIEPGDMLTGETELTHHLPAAPTISVVGDTPASVVISWSDGLDLGMCGTFAEAGATKASILYWELTVEPDEDEYPAGFDETVRVFTVQLDAGTTSVKVPFEFLTYYESQGVLNFKYEVGGVEDRVIDSESTPGNQTFSEGTFELEE